MSCRDGERCDEARKRKRALAVLFLMLLGFIVLSAWSFLDSHQQATPDQFQFAAQSADSGKQVFQAYNCMGCHTLVGNGAYFAPDLTQTYQQAGPAWLAAFLPSAGTWPTEAALKIQLSNAEIAADAGVTNLADYYQKFPGAEHRVQRRGGKPTTMPNLPFKTAEINSLIAYLKYTAAINTEGWPPQVKITHYDKRLQLAGLQQAHAAVAVAAVEAEKATVDTQQSLAAQGEALSKEYACTACHSTDKQRMVGPGWGGLYGSQVTLADGSTVIADEAYLIESIKHPDAQVVQSFVQGLMPAYETQLTDDEIAAIVAYLRTLEE